MAENVAGNESMVSTIGGDEMPEAQDAKPKNRAVKKSPEEKLATGKTSARGEQTADLKKGTPKKTASEKAGGTATSAKKAPAKKAAAKKTPAKGATAKKTPAKEMTAKEMAETQPLPAGSEAATAAPAAAAPADPESAGINPLHKKLGLREGITGVVITPPDNNDNPLSPLPEGVTVLSATEELSRLAGPYDYIHMFAREKGELTGAFPVLREKLALSGSLWVSWMRQVPGRRRGETLSDLNENIIRRIALTQGMVDVKVAALDRDWSALKLVHRKH